MDNTTSNVLSLISLGFYSIVYLPQFILIFRTKSVDGLSLWMLILWSQADALSLFGTLLLYLPINYVVMGWYHFLVGVCLIITVLFYKENNKKEYYLSILFVFSNIFIGALLNTIIKQKYDIIGGVLAWFTMSFYIIGRFPQMYTNWIRGSTEGLSLLMYIFTILGNLFYIGVIFSTPEYLTDNIPWLISGIISILLDVFIISQHFYYKNKKQFKHEIIHL